MAASGRVTLAQDGAQGNVKVHPYLAALVRWCVSSVWTAATVLLHRLMTTPHPQISGPKPPKPRPATTGHLHPEPLVECVVLHQPPSHTLDVIFVHGLYGSLANTWRQGEWRSNYTSDPIKVPLRRPDSLPTACSCTWDEDQVRECPCELKLPRKTKPQAKDDAFDGGRTDGEFYSKYRKVLPQEELFITEKFYNNTILDRAGVGDFGTQAGFVRDLFQRNCSGEGGKCDRGESVGCECGVDCQAGCGCICDRCYSPCWPRDWVKVDFPGARVISINYTSDPYLWRPLWIKQCKRQRLHERAEQMMRQLMQLGVGDKPIVWVGHSKGGLFIKQLYCEAYEAYLKTDKVDDCYFENENPVKDDNDDPVTSDNFVTDTVNNNCSNENASNEAKLSSLIDYVFGGAKNSDTDELDINKNPTVAKEVEEAAAMNDTCEDRPDGAKDSETTEASSIDAEDPKEVARRANLWKNSAGFMFYSVPHRGSPLADIKTPITARSVELLEICKDCPLVMELQDRWLRATTRSRPPVSSLVETCKTLMSLLWLRIVSVDSADCPLVMELQDRWLRATTRSRPPVSSLVETCKTLMSLLWLRIVSVDSADPGIGVLSGVSVDHREICKPSSRKCLLYRELKALITHALNNIRQF
ncbi:unnamed protein product, partial [Iphiclides podalirius]